MDSMTHTMLPEGLNWTVLASFPGARGAIWGEMETCGHRINETVGSFIGHLVEMQFDDIRLDLGG